VRPGDRFTAGDTTVNRGRRAAASGTGYALEGRGSLGVRPVPALRKRAASSGELEVAIPAELPDGEYRLVACADARREVRERDERNNCASGAAVVVDTAPPSTPSIDERRRRSRSVAMRASPSPAPRRARGSRAPWTIGRSTPARARSS
jgi:CARDB